MYGRLKIRLANFVASQYFLWTLQAISEQTASVEIGDLTMSGMLQSAVEKLKSMQKSMCIAVQSELKFLLIPNISKTQNIFSGTVTDVIFEGERLLIDWLSRNSTA
jgi:hypothetical protein